jgi:uncharacterized protein
MTLRYKCLGLALALVVSVSLYGSAWADTVANGLRAYDAGDYAAAARIWGALAEDGDPMAQLGLAGLYRQGLDVPRDLAEAARLYRAAAEQGIEDAQFNLGRLYAEGVGVPRDLVKAYLWFGLAAAHGRRGAEEWRHEVAAELTPEQLAEAERRIAAFHPR